MRLKSMLLFAICVPAAMLLVVAGADARKSSTIDDGTYATPVSLKGSASVELNVIGKGTQMASGSRLTVPVTPGVQCPVTPELEAAGFTEESTVLWVNVPTNVHLAIHNGSFSYSGPAVVGPEYIASGHPDPGTISIHGHFKGGKIVPGKTIAVTGSVSASLCGSTIPKSFSAVALGR